MNLNETFDTYRNEPCDIYLSNVIKDSQNLIFSIVINIVKHNQDAEDLTQEILIKVIQNINMLPQNTNFIGWLSKTSMNAAINLYHQKKRIGALKSDYQKAQKENSTIKEDETISVIYQHLSKLEDTEQSLLINKHMHQMTFEQLSNLYKLPVSTIRSKIDNGLKKLRFSIEKAGFASVALALVPALEKLKATEISVDLLSKVKDHFPKTYQKSSGTYSKPISKPLILGATVLTFLVFFAGITFFNQQNLSNTDFKSPELKISKTLPIAKANNSVTKKVFPSEEQITDNTIAETSKNVSNTTSELLQSIEPQKPNEKTEYAGQLLDAVTKEPIAGAKLEIWDIYTYKKIEATTDEEGKYEIPENLDKTFFFYLKFFKEGYVVKQTFQHFEIHTKILLLLNKGKKISCKIEFEKPTTGEIYLGSHFDLKTEQHLSTNQKQALQKVFLCILEKAPIEVYTTRKIKLEKVTGYSINEIPIEEPYAGFWNGSPIFREFNFSLLYEGTTKSENSIGIKDGICSISSLHSTGRYKLKMKKTGKPVAVKDLKIFDTHIKKEVVNNINNNNATDEYEGTLFHCMLTLENTDYHIHWGGRSFGLQEGKLATMVLVPYSPILFEPLSLNSKFHNSQALLGHTVLSKKSVFKKTFNDYDNLKVYDRFFEEKLLDTIVAVPIGGTIDINSELNSSERKNKNIKIAISVNDKPLKNANVYISLKENETSEFSNGRQVQLDEMGASIIKITNSALKLKLYFHVNKITYEKIINLSEIINDNIVLNLNKQFSIQLSKEVNDSYTKAKKIKIKYEDPYFNRDGDQLIISNESLIVYMPISEHSIFVENNTEYVISDPGYSTKTIFNHLKAIKATEIKIHQDKIELMPVSDLDYTTVHVEISDKNEKEIQTPDWFIIENSGHASYVRADHISHRIEFTNPEDEVFVMNGRDIGNEVSIGNEALKNKTVQLLNNRKYFLIVRFDGYINYLEGFSTKDGGTINKKVILNKPNSLKYREEKEKEFDEIVKVLMHDDIIYEYNGVRIMNKETYIKTQQACNQETVAIKLIRDNKPLTLMIPAYQIFGFENFYFDDKTGILKNEPQIIDEK